MNTPKGFTNVALASVALRIRNKASEAAVLALVRAGFESKKVF